MTAAPAARKTWLSAGLLALVGWTLITLAIAQFLVLTLIAAGGWQVMAAPLRMSGFLAILALLCTLAGSLSVASATKMRKPKFPEGLCRGCGYDLHGVRGRSCPECGLPR